MPVPLACATGGWGDFAARWLGRGVWLSRGRETRVRQQALLSQLRLLADPANAALALAFAGSGMAHSPIHGRLPLRKGFRRGWHSGLGCCHPFGLNDHRSLASMRSAGRLPIIFSGSWPWESDGLRRPRSDRSCHPQRSPSQLVEAFQGRIDLIRPKPSIDLPENALAPPSSAQLTPPHGRSRHGSAGPRGSVPACSRPRPRRR